MGKIFICLYVYDNNPEVWKTEAGEEGLLYHFPIGIRKSLTLDISTKG